MSIKYISFTDSGLKRKENEDTIYAYQKDNCSVFIVADGMGGYENGKNASDTIVRYVAKYIELDLEKTINLKTQFGDVYDSNTFFSDLKNCLLEANKEIYNNYTAKGHSSGSTLVMLAVYDGVYNIFCAGDSHIYQIVDNELVALTVDDVWENDKKQISNLTIDEIKNNPNYGRLTNAFGTVENVDIHTMNGILTSRMKFFICSDGVYKYSDKKVITKIIIENSNDDKKFCEAIKEEVYKNGAFDNMSFIYIENC